MSLKVTAAESRVINKAHYRVKNMAAQCLSHGHEMKAEHRTKLVEEGQEIWSAYVSKMNAKLDKLNRAQLKKHPNREAFQIDQNLFLQTISDVMDAASKALKKVDENFESGSPPMSGGLVTMSGSGPLGMGLWIGLPDETGANSSSINQSKIGGE